MFPPLVSEVNLALCAAVDIPRMGATQHHPLPVLVHGMRMELERPKAVMRGRMRAPTTGKPCQQPLRI
jgi:hypothetical protein